MHGRMLIRMLTAVLGLLLPLALTQATASAAPPATPDADPGIQVRTVYYDASQAGQWVQTVHSAAAIWNSRVTNVRLVSGSPATIRVYTDSGWPRAYVQGLGRGYWYMGMQAVNQGYYPLRIATHEFGHLLGLPDRRTGLCSDLMSGSSAPVSCTNAYPSAAEAYQVNLNFAGMLSVPAGVYAETG
ncbi:MAG TPA: snapalysin family zinc-dependent metalloprotease [Pseudonocardiaceae bacterium]